MSTTTQVLGKVGLVDKGIYSSSTTYSRLDFVTDANNISTYISLKDSNKGQALTNTTYWRYLAKGTADAATIRDLLKTVDGAGSGIDADTLDGTQLEEIVNPEALAAASPFDYFLGAKEVDGKWVFKKMSPSDVATVVAGFMGNPGGTKALDSIQDCNNIVENGIYPCYSTPANSPSGITGSCLVICFASESLKMQFLLNEPTSDLYCRRKYFSNAWGSWRQISKS